MKNGSMAPGSFTKAKFNFPIVLAGIIFIISFFLRIYNIEKYDLWFDEIGTDSYATYSIHRTAESEGRTPEEIFVRQLKQDPHSSLYFTLAYVYSHIFGDGKMFRYLSLLLSMLALGILYMLANKLFNQRTALFALLMMGFSPFHLWYAQEARAYALVSFCSLWMMYIFVRAVKTDKTGYWVLLPFVSFLCVLSSYFTGILYLFSGLLLFIQRKWRTFQKWGLGFFCVCALLFLLRPIVFGQIGFVKDGFWITPPTFLNLLYTWKVFIMGFSATDAGYVLALVTAVPLFLFGTFSGYKKYGLFGLFPAALAVLPVAVVFVYSRLFIPVYLNRQLIGFSPFFYLVMASGLDSIVQRKFRWTVVFVLLAILSWGAVNYHRGVVYDNPAMLGAVFPKKHYAPLLDHFSRMYRKDDLLAVRDLDSFVLMRSYLIKNMIDVSFKKVEYYFKPEILNVFEARYLRIQAQIDELSPAERSSLFVYTLPEDNEPLLKKTSWPELQHKRIWFISVNAKLDNKPEAFFRLGAPCYAPQYTRTLLKQKDGVSIELCEQ